MSDYKGSGTMQGYSYEPLIHREPLGTTPWRVTGDFKRGVSDCNGQLVCIVETPDIASLIVEGVNGYFGKGVEPPIISPANPVTTT